jgi:uncharacterized membrane protein
MHKLTTLLFAILLVFAIAPAGEASAQDGQPVVHTVLFWTNGCQNCTQTLTGILPEMQQKYQAQLNIQLIEVASTEDIDKLYAFGASLGLAKEQVGVPFLLIDHTALVGVDEIDARLPGLIEDYLAKGGVEVPDMPILNEMRVRGVDFATSDHLQSSVLQATPQAYPLGMVLAWIILVLMVLAVIFAIIMILRGSQGKTLHEFKDCRDFLVPALSLLGLGAALYLTYVEVTGSRAICGPVGDCNAVQTSPYAKLFGFLPVAWLGAAGYLTILAGWLWRHVRQDALAKAAGPSMYGMALFGTLFSIYLTYLELFVIHAVCVWCLFSAVIITALMLLTLPSITQWLAIPEED